MEKPTDEVDEQPLYSVFLTKAAKASLPFIVAKSHRAKVRKMLQMIDTVPEMGRVYDPDYPATLPPFEVRVTYAGRYGIYYTINEDAQEVYVISIEDQRRDPLNRHFGIYPHEAE